MLVPRSFKYASSPPASMIEHKSTLRNRSRDNNNTRSATSDAKNRSHASARPHTPTQPTTDTMRPRSQPVDVPSPEKARRSGSQTVGYAKGRSAGAGRRKQIMPDQHRAEALSPSVAALLAMTTIPRRPKQTRRRSSDRRQISIDELVNEWKSDERLAKSYESSPLSMLLEDADDSDASRSPSFRSNRHGRPQYERSASSDSVPSLEGDQNSLFSVGSPATPNSLRSRKSSMNMRKETPKSQPARESCAEDHPLASLPGIDDEDFDYASTPLNSITSKPKSSFKSNLTTSLQALKSAALSPFAPRKTTSAPNLRSKRTTTKPESTASLSPLPDDVLWSHPFLFPRFSPEVRPAYKGTPTSAERRYLNPIPLSFEEQEAPFQQALHAPYLAEQHVHHGPTIQMQTYSRSGRSGKGKTGKAGVDSDSDGASANKAAVAAMMRQREPRENSDFLRIVVMEMNMRREGKLEMGRAKIWLPPRQTAEGDVVVQGKVPRRWIGESAG